MSKKYQYVESGIGWVGKCPKHWALRRIKDIAFLQSGEAITSLSINDTDEFPVFGGNGLRGFTSTYNHDGSYVLIGRQGALCGNINYAHGKFFASEHAVVVYPHYEMNVIWLGELLREMNLNQYSNAAAQPGLAVEKIKGLKIPVPPKKEQTAIANYLAKAFAAIDRVIELKRKQLETLEQFHISKVRELIKKSGKSSLLNESGIEFIGRIPSHWKVDRLKFYVSKIGSGVTPKGGAATYVDTGVPLIRSQNVYNDGLRLDDVCFITEQVHDEMSNSKVAQGDVLLNITGASIGRCCVFDEIGEANVNQHVCIIRPTNKLRPGFLHYLLISEVGQSQIFSGFTGSSREGLNFEEIKNFRIFIPPVHEQDEIIQAIEKFEMQAKAVRSKIEKQIAMLEAYKKSLIHEVVTGKKQVYFEEDPILQAATADALTV